MKSISIKSIEVFSNGTISFSYTHFKSNKQVIFYEKDFLNSIFSKSSKKSQQSKSIFRTSYKSKYKF